MHVWASPTAWTPSAMGSPAASRKRRQPVDEPAHGPHAADRFERTVGEELVGARQQPAGLLEPVGIAERGPQLAVGDRARPG